MASEIKTTLRRLGPEPFECLLLGKRGKNSSKVHEPTSPLSAQEPKPLATITRSGAGAVIRRGQGVGAKGQRELGPWC